jgi:hypothetical protein
MAASQLKDVFHVSAAKAAGSAGLSHLNSGDEATVEYEYVAER